MGLHQSVARPGCGARARAHALAPRPAGGTTDPADHDKFARRFDELTAQEAGPLVPGRRSVRPAPHCGDRRQDRGEPSTSPMISAGLTRRGTVRGVLDGRTCPGDLAVAPCRRTAGARRSPARRIEPGRRARCALARGASCPAQVAWRTRCDAIAWVLERERDDEIEISSDVTLDVRDRRRLAVLVVLIHGLPGHEVTCGRHQVEPSLVDERDLPGDRSRPARLRRVEAGRSRPPTPRPCSRPTSSACSTDLGHDQRAIWSATTGAAGRRPGVAVARARSGGPSDRVISRTSGLVAVAGWRQREKSWYMLLFQFVGWLRDGLRRR